MNKVNELLQRLCPEWVENVPLWSVTIWDKKFSGIDRKKQSKTINYNYLLASDLFSLETDSGNVFLLSTGEKTGWTTEELAGQNLHEGEVVTIPWGKSRAVTDCIKYYKGKFVTADNRIMTSNDTEKLSNRYLYYWVMSVGKVIDSFYRGSGIKHPDMAKVLDLRIPVPPLEVQQEIVRILDQFTQFTAELNEKLTEELTARGKQYQEYITQLLTFKGDVDWYALDNLFNIKNGYTPSKKVPENWNGGDIPWFRMEDIRLHGRILTDATQHITKGAVKKSGLFQKGSIVLSTTATLGEYALIETEFLCNQQLTCFTIKETFSEQLLPKFAFYYFNIIGSQCYDIANYSGGIPIVDQKKLKKLSFPLPPLPEQSRIVAILDRFDSLCNDLTSGLPAEIAARQKQYEYYRDKLLTFPERKP